MSDEKPKCPGKKTLVINKGAVDEYTDEKLGPMAHPDEHQRMGGY